MKSLLVLCLCLASNASARAETISSPCQASGFYFDGNVPLSFDRVPVRPTVPLPISPAFGAAPSPDLALIDVEVRNGDDVIIPGRVRAGADVSPYLYGPVWQPEDDLPLGPYTLHFTVAVPHETYACSYTAFEGDQQFVVADDPATPSLSLSAWFRDSVIWDAIGLSRSCGPGSIACADVPGVCCVRERPQTLRTLYLDVTVSDHDRARASSYRVVYEATSADQGIWSEARTLEGDVTQSSRVTALAVDAAAPSAGDGCAKVVLRDMLAGGVVVATVAGCADPERYVRDREGDTCAIVCEEHVIPEGTELVADPAGVIPDGEPDHSDGCAGGAGSGLGLVALMLRRRRVSTP